MGSFLDATLGAPRRLRELLAASEPVLASGLMTN
jgi:hypothetical protein